MSLYRRQLIDTAGARHVRGFEMINAGNRTEYFLYFATNNARGLSKMKQAMWKADPVGGQVFSDLTDPRQMVLLDTPYSEAIHLKRRTLAEMEKQGPRLIEVRRPGKATSFTVAGDKIALKSSYFTTRTA